MNTPRQILNNTIALTIAQVGQLVGNMIFFLYLSRTLQAEGLGIYATVLAVFNTVSIGCEFGFRTFIPRELPKDLSKTNRYLIHASLVALISAVALLAGLNIVVPHLGYLPETVSGIRIISLALIPTALQVILNAIFVAHQKGQFITISSLFRIIGQVLAGLLLLTTGFGITSLIITYTIFSYLSLFIAIYFLTRHIITLHWEFDRRFLLGMLRLLKIFAGLALLGALFSNVEVIILSLTYDEVQVGFFTAGFKLVTIWSIIPDAYMTVIFPVMSVTYQQFKQKAINIQNRSIKYLWSTAFPLAVVMTVTADDIILLLYGPGFEEAAWALRFLAWYLPLNFCNIVLWRSLLARNEQHKVLRGQLIADFLRVCLAILLTPKFGIYGAAWTLLAGRLVYLIYNVYQIRRDGTSLPLVQLGWRFVIASALMGIFVSIFAQWIHLLVLIPLATVVYVTLIFILRAFSQDDLKLFRQLLVRKRESGSMTKGAVTID